MFWAPASFGFVFSLQLHVVCLLMYSSTLLSASLFHALLTLLLIDVHHHQPQWPHTIKYIKGMSPSVESENVETVHHFCIVTWYKVWLHIAQPYVIIRGQLTLSACSLNYGVFACLICAWLVLTLLQCWPIRNKNLHFCWHWWSWKEPRWKKWRGKSLQVNLLSPSAKSHERQRALESDPKGDRVCMRSFIQWSVICVASQRAWQTFQ